MNLLSLGGVIEELLNTLVLAICQPIYILISWLYQLYERICSINLFSSEVFEEITGRIYVIMGIAMLFIFAYNLILMVINPDDKKGTGETGKVVKNTVISLIVVVLLPTIFNYLYIIQSHVLESNIISQIILGTTGSTSGTDDCDANDYECKCDYSNYDNLDKYNNQIRLKLFGIIKIFDFNWGTDKTDNLNKACKAYKNDLTPSQRGAYSVAPTVFAAFYHPNEFDYDDCAEYIVNNDTSIINDSTKEQICVNYYYDVNFSRYSGNVIPMLTDTYLNNQVTDNDGGMTFSWFPAIIAGGLAAWMFWCYAWEVGVRVAKLGFLQMISPITVMLRIVPKQGEKIFDEWFKNVKSAYLDVFIRLFIINFALFGISLIPSVLKTIWSSTINGDGGFVIKSLAAAILILGIMKFAQEAPKLLKDIFQLSGNFPLRSVKKQVQDNKMAMGIIGGATSAVKTSVGNVIRTYNVDDDKAKPSTGEVIRSGLGGFGAGAYRGFKEGYKSKDFDELDTAVTRAKATNDEHYAARARRRETNREIFDENGTLGGIVEIAKNKFDDGKETVVSWGAPATDNAKRKANSEVESYDKTTQEYVDKKSKATDYESMRDRMISQLNDPNVEFENFPLLKRNGFTNSSDIADVKKFIRDYFGQLADDTRAETIRDFVKDKDETFIATVENLTRSMESNKDFLEGISGDKGMIQRLVDKNENNVFDMSALSESCRQAFSGNLDDFVKGLNDFVKSGDKVTMEDAKAFQKALYEISKVTGSNQQRLSLEQKKK